MDKAPDALFMGFMGDDTFCFDQARALKAKGLNVAVFRVDVSAHAMLKPFSLGITQEVRDGMPWYKISVPFWNRESPVFTKLYDLIRKKIIMWAFNKLYTRAFGKNAAKPLLIHAHFENGDTSIVIANKLNIPVFITEHWGNVLMEDKFRLLVKHEIYLCRSATKVIAVSSAIAKKLHEISGVVCEVIPNIIDVRTFTHVWGVHDGFGFVNTGGLVWEKNQESLINAFASVHALHKDTYLGIIGSGYLHDNLQQQVKALELQDSVKFYGHLTRQTINQVYKSYDCFVVSSHLESFNVSAAEAMAAGLPVIATKCGGPEDFVNDKTGLLVPVNDVEAMSSAMLKMYETRTNYDSEYISRYANEHFSPEVVASRIIEVYKEVCPNFPQI